MVGGEQRQIAEVQKASFASLRVGVKNEIHTEKTQTKTFLMIGDRDVSVRGCQW